MPKIKKEKLSRLKSRTTALMIIDMQNDFTEKGAIIEVNNIRKGFLKFKKFISFCRDKGLLIIYTRHVYSPKNNPVEALLLPELKNEGLRKNTHGFEIDNYLKPQVSDIVLNKTRYDAFFKTNLEKLLRKKGVTDIIITGTMTEVCCESTARSAMFRDFNIWFISDLNFTSNKKKHANSLKTKK